LEAEGVVLALAHAEPAVGVGAFGAVARGPTQGIAIGVGPGSVGQVAEIAGPAEGAGHLIDHLLGRLLERVERLALRSDRVARRAAAQRLGGIAHGAIGAAEGLGHIALLAQLAHDIAQHAPKRILLGGITLSLTLSLLLALLPALALLTLARLAEGAVEQLLLALLQLLQVAHGLVAVALHL